MNSNVASARQPVDVILTKDAFLASQISRISRETLELTNRQISCESWVTEFMRGARSEELNSRPDRVVSFILTHDDLHMVHPLFVAYPSARP